MKGFLIFFIFIYHLINGQTIQIGNLTLESNQHSTINFVPTLYENNNAFLRFYINGLSSLNSSVECSQFRIRGWYTCSPLLCETEISSSITLVDFPFVVDPFLPYEQCGCDSQNGATWILNITNLEPFKCNYAIEVDQKGFFV